MGITSVKVVSAIDVIKNLNAVLSVTETSGSEDVGDTCGLYALINQMISDLSSIKATIKAEEKKIESGISGIMGTNTSVALNAAVFTEPVRAGAGADFNVADITATTNGGGLTAGGTLRGHDATAANNVAILPGSTDNTTGLTELAVISLLGDAFLIIKKLKNYGTSQTYANSATADGVVTTVVGN